MLTGVDAVVVMAAAAVMTGLDEIGVRLVDPETTRLNWKRGTVWAADTEAVGRLAAGATDVVPTEGRD